MAKKKGKLPFYIIKMVVWNLICHLRGAGDNVYHDCKWLEVPCTLTKYKEVNQGAVHPKADIR